MSFAGFDAPVRAAANQRLKLTGAAIPLSRDMKILQAAPGSLAGTLAPKERA